MKQITPSIKECIVAGGSGSYRTSLVDKLRSLQSSQEAQAGLDEVAIR